MRALTLACPLVIILVLPALTRAETAVPAWVQSYAGPRVVSGQDWGAAVAVDRSNNVIVTGSSFGGGSYEDYATIKYSSAGVPLWTNRFNGSAECTDSATALAVDGDNNVIVTGYSLPLFYGEAANYATIKYSRAGVPLWTNRYHGPDLGDSRACAAAADGSNNVIVTGSSFGGGSYRDYATIKYSSAGVPLWTNRYNGSAGGSDDLARAVAVDGSNNVIVTGSAVGNGLDYATIKYSSGGEPLWTNLYNGPAVAGNQDQAYAVAVDGSNNVIVTGSSYGNGSWLDYATIKYSSAGVPLWTNRYSRPGSSDDVACAVAVDGSNNVLVLGGSDSTGGSTRFDYVTIKYSSAGVALWTNSYRGPQSIATAKALAVDASNSVIVTGWATILTGDDDYVTIKYSRAGVPLWTNRYNGPVGETDRALAVAVDGSGSVIVAGYSTGFMHRNEFATVKYICAPEPVMSGLQLADGTFQLRVDDVLQPGTLVIEAGTNLAAWAPVFTNTTPTNVLFYTDPEAGTNPARFYRAFQFP